MRRLPFLDVIVAMLAFMAGVAFQRSVGIGAVRSWLSSDDAKVKPVDPGQLKNETTFCILAFGQSNAANHGLPKARVGQGIYSFNDGVFFPASDPLPGASGTGGSVWTRLGPRLRTNPENQSLVIACVAQGSSSVVSWRPSGENFKRVRNAVNGLGAAGLRVDLVIWHQGETESWTSETDGVAYQNSLSSVIVGVRQLGVSAPVLVCKTSRDGKGVVNESVRLAQASVCNPNKGVFPGPDTDALGSEFRHDGVHWNGRGLDAFAIALEETITRSNWSARSDSDYE